MAQPHRQCICNKSIVSIIFSCEETLYPENERNKVRYLYCTATVLADWNKTTYVSFALMVKKECFQKSVIVTESLKTFDYSYLGPMTYAAASITSILPPRPS